MQVGKGSVKEPTTVFKASIVIEHMATVLGVGRRFFETQAASPAGIIRNRLQLSGSHVLFEAAVAVGHETRAPIIRLDIGRICFLAL